jgi:NAD+ synthase (glutamine-hydrolysing)
VSRPSQPPVKIALVQTNPLIGAFERNFNAVLHWIAQAREQHCDLVVFPELTLCGYPPQDLLERVAFLDAHDRFLHELIRGSGSMAIIVGALERREGPGKPLFNSALVLQGGKVVTVARKQLLPSYDVFDETRYFEAGSDSTVFALKDRHFGLTVCEDIWAGNQPYPVNPVKELVIGGVVPDCLINISASPYYHGKIGERRRVFGQLCRDNGFPLIYVNQVGGQDSLVFDGHSMVVGSSGQPLAVAAGFREDMLVVDNEVWERTDLHQAALDDSIAHVLDALVLGVRDYLHKSGFRQAVLGLSGGIDSAVTAAIGVLALGPDNVRCLAMPSPYTAQQSVDDARRLAENLGCGFEVIAIADLMAAYGQTLAPLFADLKEDVTEQNIQARIRGNLLMAVSNKMGSLLLSTGNKSEMAVGYCTLYGDMSGGLAVLADVPKVMVYQLARYLNRQQEVIPDSIIIRPPTAELKADQRDQDDLPPYEVLDAVLHAYLEEHRSIEAIVADGVDFDLVRDIVRRIRNNEYKRKQAPLGIKVTTKAFGPGRRYPVVHGFFG